MLMRKIQIFRKQYIYAGPITDSAANLLTRNKIAETRDILSRLNTALRESLEALHALQGNVQAMRLYCARTGPAGKSIKVLQPLANAARAAHVEAIHAPDKTSDYAPAGLAMGVVETMRRLSLKVTMASDRKQAAPGKRGGAGYARLLRAALTAAGYSPPDDLTGIMKTGKEMAAMFDE